MFKPTAGRIQLDINSLLVNIYTDRYVGNEGIYIVFALLIGRMHTILVFVIYTYYFPDIATANLQNSIYVRTLVVARETLPGLQESNIFWHLFWHKSLIFVSLRYVSDLFRGRQVSLSNIFESTLTEVSPNVSPFRLYFL